MSDRERTVSSMHDTAEQLHVSAGTLYRSSLASPNEKTTDRLQALGDDVTNQAHTIDRRADQLDMQTPRGVATVPPTAGAHEAACAGTSGSRRPDGTTAP